MKLWIQNVNVVLSTIHIKHYLAQVLRSSILHGLHFCLPPPPNTVTMSESELQNDTMNGSLNNIIFHIEIRD